jgi:transposase
MEIFATGMAEKENRMPIKQTDWTPQNLLEAWGLRAFGALTNPYKLSTGNRALTDDESQAAWYVENTVGFERAKEVLIWRYRRGEALADFPIRQPGETLARGLLRRCWGDMLGRTPYRIAQTIHDEFFDLLSDRVVREPFRPVRVVDEELVA